MTDKIDLSTIPEGKWQLCMSRGAGVCMARMHHTPSDQQFYVVFLNNYRCCWVTAGGSYQIDCESEEDIISILPISPLDFRVCGEVEMPKQTQRDTYLVCA